MSFEDRMLALDSDITDLEGAVPFVLTQDFPPNQINWEDAWIGAGNTLPIPNVQELYWKDDFALRGEYKTLPDQFSLLARSQSTGFQIRDIAGWEDDDHLIVYIIRDDSNAPQGACRMYMDGTLEQITLSGFTPTGLLGYDRTNGLLWYVDSSFRIRYINVNTLAIVTVATAANANNLPEWRFFVLLSDGSGDAYYGARLGADAQRSLYFYDISALTNTNVLGTFNPGGGAVNADRPVAATTGYVFLSTIHTRSAFDGNKLHQITRSGHTWQVQVNHGTFSNEVRVLVSKTNYSANTIEVVVGHLTTAVLVEDWNFTTLWNAATQTATTTPNQPHNAMLQILRQNVNDHSLAYHMDTRLYYDPAFVADGGSEAHFNSIGALVLNPNGDKYLIHDLGWHTWTVSDAPDIYLFADSTHKIYRISDWSQFGDDIILIAADTLNPANQGDSIDLSSVSADYGMIEVIQEIYTTVAGTSVGDETVGGSQFHSDNIIALQHIHNVAAANFYMSELTTNASIKHYLYIRRKLTANREITRLSRHSVRTNFNPGTGIQTHAFSEGFYLKNNESEILTIAVGAGNSNICRYVIRAWRTVPRMKAVGAEYDPSMA